MGRGRASLPVWAFLPAHSSGLYGAASVLLPSAATLHRQPAAFPSFPSLLSKGHSSCTAPPGVRMKVSLEGTELCVFQ